VAEFRLSRLAIADLAEIADYTIETFGIEQARVYRDGLEACFRALAANPNLGRRAERLAPMLKRYKHHSHEVFYLATNHEILIVRILHERMDFGRYL
jgi:toxin ParE1/3/4